MSYHSIMLAGFKDELTKIAGEMQGFTRIGRKPISVERLLEREAESDTTPTEAINGEEKTSEVLTPGRKAVALMAAGAGGYHVARKANEDRKMGKMVRLQQQGQ